MNEYLKNNQSALRTCILYEFIGGKPVFESYQNMCRRIGDDMINYVDFEYWWLRFANGKFDLNYDRSLDPKSRSLSDMPIHIFEKIVYKLELIDRFSIGKVSKNFQYIIDSWNSRFKKIRIEIYMYYRYLYFNDTRVTYGKTGKNSVNHLKSAIDDLASVLKNPKLQLHELEVSRLDEKLIPEFKSMLKSLNQKIHVKKFCFIPNLRDMNGAMAILPYLDAGTLEEIVLNFKYSHQCEKPKPDELRTIMVQLGESLLQFRRLTIDISLIGQQRTKLLFTKILLESTVLEVAILKTNQINISTFLCQLGCRAIEIQGRPNVRRFPIPESNQLFEIEANSDSIRIERTS